MYSRKYVTLYACDKRITSTCSFFLFRYKKIELNFQGEGNQQVRLNAIWIA